MSTRAHSYGSHKAKQKDTTSSDLFDEFVSTGAKSSPNSRHGGVKAKESSSSKLAIMYDFSYSPGKKISPSLRRESPIAKNGSGLKSSSLAGSIKAKKQVLSGKGGGKGKGGKGKPVKPKLLAVFDFESDEEEEEMDDEETKIAQRIQSKTRPKKPPPPRPAPPSLPPIVSPPVSSPLSTKWKKVQRLEKKLVIEQSSDKVLLGENKSSQSTMEGKKGNFKPPMKLTTEKWKKSPTKAQLGKMVKGSPTVVAPSSHSRGGDSGLRSTGTKRAKNSKADTEGPAKKKAKVTPKTNGKLTPLTTKLTPEIDTGSSQESLEVSHSEIFLGPSIVPKLNRGGRSVSQTDPISSRRMKWTLRSHIRAAEEARLTVEEEEFGVEEQEDGGQREVGEQEGEEKRMETEPEDSQQPLKTPVSETGITSSQEFSMESSPELSTEDPLAGIETTLNKTEESKEEDGEKQRQQSEGGEEKKQDEEQVEEEESQEMVDTAKAPCPEPGAGRSPEDQQENERKNEEKPQSPSGSITQPESSPLESSKPDSKDLEPEHGDAEEEKVDESLDEALDLSLSEPVDHPVFTKKFERHLEGLVSCSTHSVCVYISVHVSMYITMMYGLYINDHRMFIHFTICTDSKWTFGQAR